MDTGGLEAELERVVEDELVGRLERVICDVDGGVRPAEQLEGVLRMLRDQGVVRARVRWILRDFASAAARVESEPPPVAEPPRRRRLGALLGAGR